MAEVEITALSPGEHNAISGEMNKQAERGRLCFLKSHQFRNGDGGGGVWQIQPQTQRSDCLFILHRYTQCLTQNAPVCVHCLDGLARWPDRTASCSHITSHFGYDDTATPHAEQEMRTLNILSGFNSENGRGIAAEEKDISIKSSSKPSPFCLARASNFR